MTPDKTTEALKTYAALMDEARERLMAIEKAANWNGLAPKFITEFCALQFRMLCETIALGCLVAHGDVGSLQVAKSTRDKWHAGELMTALGKMHAEFFPRPHNTKRIAEHVLHFEPVPNHLSKEALIQFYGRLGETLHMGRLADRLSGKKSTRPYTGEEIIGNAQAIFDLLNIHMFKLIDGRLVVCFLCDPTRGGKAHVALASGALPKEEWPPGYEPT